ncbi:MAG TPA: hypothetical protein ENH85_05470 [Candidatus Scalindua sp.]|nr:hypothetical protein [Candidatus Scalindua sp.]
MPTGVYKHKKPSEITRKRMSETHKRIGTGKWNKGRRHSAETKEKISKTSQGRPRKYHGKGFQKGHPDFVSREARKQANEKTSQLLKGRYVGEKHWNWKGGKYGEHRREYKRFKTAERQSQKLQASGSHTLGEWEILKAQYNWICPCCGKKEPEIRLTEDHIVPITKGGSDNIENIQPLCKSCNSRKQTRVIKYYLAKIKELQ